MTRKSSTATDSPVTRLRERQDVQSQPESGSVIPVCRETNTTALECLLGSPRFSIPANEGFAAQDQDEVPAPAGKAAREARLLRLWVETLAEFEEDRPSPRRTAS